MSKNTEWQQVIDDAREAYRQSLADILDSEHGDAGDVRAADGGKRLTK